MDGQQMVDAASIKMAQNTLRPRPRGGDVIGKPPTRRAREEPSRRPLQIPSTERKIANDVDEALWEEAAAYAIRAR